MDESRTSASRRLLDRALKRAGLAGSDPPSHAAWLTFLDLIRALLAGQEQERYLLEQSLEISSQEMLSLNESLRRSAERLAADRSVLAATLESTADGILVVGVDGRISHFNRRFAEMWEIPNEILDARDDNAALTFVLGQLRDPQAFIARVEALYETPDAASQDTLEFKDGRVFERESLPQYLDGEIIGRVWSFRDVTAERRLHSELQYRAVHDVLTGLANRAAFEGHLHQALRRQGRTGGHVAVVVVDLDGFKHINDSLGHQVGDNVLLAIAERFRSVFRDLDSVARLGGDEFALLVEDVGSPEQAARLGQRLLDTMVDPLDVGGRPVSLGASVGITIAEGATAEPERLIGQADAAMYRAKRDGKGRYQLFEASMHTLAVERLNLEQALRMAVTNGELTVHYQPVVDAATGRVDSFEALARWCHPERGFVEPGVFIPLAEETGLIHDIGRSVLLTACRQAQVWLADDPTRRTGIAVNVSGRQLLEPSFVEMVSGALAGTGLDPRALTLEITESVFAADAPHALEALQQLRRRGIGVAIDDFGTGYSSFATLADLPIDTIKIDKRFVDGLDDDRGRGIVGAIIGIAQTLGLSTVAEGVEDPAAQLALVDLGCRQIQGFLFARPMPAEETLPFLRGQASSPAIPSCRPASETDAAA